MAGIGFTNRQVSINGTGNGAHFKIGFSGRTKYQVNKSADRMCLDFICFSIDDDIATMNLGNNRSQFFAPKSIGWCDGQPRSWLVDEYKIEKKGLSHT